MSRPAVAVVMAVVILCSARLAMAADAKPPRSESCLELCNWRFEKCQQQESAKKPGSRCNIDIVKCKQECPPEPADTSAVPTERTHTKCVDACREVYKKCLGRPENKRGGPCAADDVRCEKGCPKPPEAEVAAPAPNAPPGSPAAATGSAAAPPPSAAKPRKPRAAARVEGAAAPAPVSAPPAAARGEVAPTVHSEAVAPPAKAPAEASETAARPAGAKRGFWGTLKCFFVACEREASTPCLDQCATAYDECRVRESKRGGECNTRLMNCRQSCGGTAR
jgi:hypothetical protein